MASMSFSSDFPCSKADKILNKLCLPAATCWR